MTFGEKVKAERTKLGLTQEELAAKVGVTVRVICSYENDKSRPRGTERYKKLAEALNVNVNHLLSEGSLDYCKDFDKDFEKCIVFESSCQSPKNGGEVWNTG